MNDNVIRLPRRRLSNVEALASILGIPPPSFRSTEPVTPQRWAQFVIMCLWTEGYNVTPIPGWKEPE